MVKTDVDILENVPVSQQQLPFYDLYFFIKVKVWVINHKVVFLSYINFHSSRCNNDSMLWLSVLLTPQWILLFLPGVA